MSKTTKQFIIQCPFDVDEAALSSALASFSTTMHKHVLVDTSFGNLSIDPASLKEAKELVDSIIANVPSEAINIAVNNSKILTKEFIFKIINRILASPAGTQVSRSIVSTQEMIDEIQLYAFKHKLDTKNGELANQSQFLKVTPDISVFSFFKDNENFKDVELVDEYIAYIADDYRPIFHNTWKEGTSEISIIRRHIEFYKQFSHRDVEVSIQTL